MTGKRAWPPRRRLARLPVPAFLLVTAVLALGASAMAQQQQPRITEPEDPSRQQRRFGRELERGVRESSDDQLLRPERLVTYDDVLRNPDDVDVNFAWAQMQIAEGDVKGAAATLERILLLYPNLPRVRLLLAVVLYRLDRLGEAEQEFVGSPGTELEFAL